MMKQRTIAALKCVVFPLCLVPAGMLLRRALHEDLGADPVAEITHVTGRWALYMLLAALAVTPVRRLWSGLAWVGRFRRMLGLFAFFYATLHLLTYVLLFSGLDVPGAWAAIAARDWHGFAQLWVGPWQTMQTDVLKRRFIWAGLSAWTLLMLLAVTSPVFVLRWMGGKNWRRLHWAVYAAGLLAVVHFWWLVKPGVTRPMRPTLIFSALILARVAWWAKEQVKARRRPAAKAAAA
jgi:sulfoxide reductase heme-binding subunit YedZ